MILSIAGILGSSSNVFATFYLLAQGGRARMPAISLLTGVFTLATSAIALPYFGWQAAGWSACIGMIAQMVTCHDPAAPAFQPHRRMVCV